MLVNIKDALCRIFGIKAAAEASQKTIMLVIDHRALLILEEMRARTPKCVSLEEVVRLSLLAYEEQTRLVEEGGKLYFRRPEGNEIFPYDPRIDVGLPPPGGGQARFPIKGGRYCFPD